VYVEGLIRTEMCRGRGKIRLEIAIRKAADVEGNEYGLDGDAAYICACVILIGGHGKGTRPWN